MATFSDLKQRVFNSTETDVALLKASFDVVPGRATCQPKMSASFSGTDSGGDAKSSDDATVKVVLLANSAEDANFAVDIIAELLKVTDLPFPHLVQCQKHDKRVELALPCPPAEALAQSLPAGSCRASVLAPPSPIPSWWQKVQMNHKRIVFLCFYVCVFR